jgi:hypothetical protein
MRQLMTFTTVLLIVLLSCSAVFAQGAFRGAATAGSYDPRDFSGIWLLQDAIETIGPNPAMQSEWFPPNHVRCGTDGDHLHL